MKIAVITCYKQPDYVRAQTLRRAVELAGHELIVIKNSQRGVLRYAEVAWRTLVERLSQRPDVYILTFRGYEIIPLINLLTWPKPLIFDEFINPLEWLLEPRPEAWVRWVPKGLLRGLYRLLLRRARFVLADTPAHAAYSEQLTLGKAATGPDHTVTGRYVALPVSTDELVFTPSKQKAAAPAARKPAVFKVFYYGNMLPLHGLPLVLEAAVQLKKLPVEFTIIGGKTAAAQAVKTACKNGANITYQQWVDYRELPGHIHQADLCLGGPFGDTTQAGMVITGKTYQFLACGVPVLISDTPAAQHFTHQKDCLKVPLGSAAAIAKAIAWAAGHPAALANIGQQGRHLYQSQFSNAVLAHQLQELLQKLAP